MRRDTTAYSAVRPEWDKNDCSVRALACATGVHYIVASMTFTAQGRSVKKGTPTELSTKLHEEVLGMRRIEMAEGMRLEDFVGFATTGSFIIHKAHHAFAVVDGVIHDWENTTKDSTKIVRAWKVTEKAREKMSAMAKMVEELGL